MSGTARYRFEHHLITWAEDLSQRLCGERCAMFLGLREQGSLRRIYFAVPGETIDGERKAALARTYPRWLLYAPGARRGSGYLEWLGVDEVTAARWLGRALAPEDFQGLEAAAARPGWPRAWRTLIA